jgi:large subunit ribosomal protein L3
MKGIIGRKLGMTRVFNDQGRAVPVTVIEVGPCPVIQVKTKDSDGYEAIQIGFGKRKATRTNKARAGHFAKSGQQATHLLRELRMDDVSGFDVGAQITVELFKVGERVKVTGFTKGKGFQGVVKRWGFRGGPASHGSKSSREAGSIGQCATPAKVWKNRKMPGQTGNRKKTVSNLEVVQVDLEKNLIAVKGAVPGHANGYVMVTGKA